MMCAVPLLLLALTVAQVAPAAIYDDYVEAVPQKRAALVLDRLLIALQKALHEESGAMRYERPDRDGPRAAPLRIAADDLNDMSSLERRGQANTGRGRVLRCYFNAVTCF
ncbi:hypothetical protein K1T71_007846 [Dendrolimus kikuchii]|uniref:Uncharacterized protein n=1 Tax=Dendrolimus kikuchii TaxID=765133 RepID=A0ACC1CZE6_9NEOP|nr:hypothetical protein K1T71_007846 [Dendrolimus kikuchii]